MRTIRIGTRGSALALAQTALVKAALLERLPDLDLEVCIIKTTGDLLAQAPLEAIGGKGVFVKEIEGRLLDGTIDLAVHSLKDMPSAIPPRLTIGAYLEREDPRDMLFASPGCTLAELPQGARVGTSSLRRICQLKALRPDIACVAIRGNVPTRLGKIGPDLEAVILAAAGVKRLGLPSGTPIDADTLVPSPGQGIIALELRADDAELQTLIAPLEHASTRQCALAERAFLAALGADCRIPAGAHAVLDDGGRIRMQALIGSPDGQRIVRMHGEGDTPDIGRRLGEALADAFYGGRA